MIPTSSDIDQTCNHPTEDLSDRLFCRVINLDSFTDRLANFHKNMEKTGLSIPRFSAVGGASSPIPKGFCEENAFHRLTGRKAARGEIGCYASHIAVMRQFLDSGLPFALIFEDDFLPVDEFGSIVRKLLVMPGWDLVRFASIREKTSLPCATITGKYRLCVTVTGFTVTAGYMINRRGAERLLKKLIPMCLPYDLALHTGWPGVREFTVCPEPCLRDPYNSPPSTIVHNSRYDSILGFYWWTGRLYRLASRLRRYPLQIARYLKIILSHEKFIAAPGQNSSCVKKGLR